MPRGKTYTNNAYNRSIGRVGAPMGSMSVSRSSGGGGGGGGAAYSSGSQSTYVDNSTNRSAGRVGMPMGSMPISKSSSGASAYGTGSSGTYVDNAYNRQVGRVGMSHGSMPISRPSSGASAISSSGTYVDNAYNRQVGRVGMPHGSMPISKSGSSSASPSNPIGVIKVYKDNVLNRRLGRVGEPLGCMPHSKSGASSGETRRYVDNSMNQRLGRVGMLVGTMSVSKKRSSTNKRKGDQTTHVWREMYDGLLRNPDEDAFVQDFPTDVPVQEQDFMYEAVMGLVRRMNDVLKWQETSQVKDEQPHTSLHEFKYDGPVIKFEEIELLNKIGQGGFGDVHFAKYKGTVVAVKKLRVQRVSQRRLRQFQEEVKVLCHLDHPHIVKFLGACTITPNLAIVMEYMQKSLHEALHVEEVDYSDKEQYQILLHMAEGLAYLHEKSVAHCDMKSTNILLDDSEDGVVAKISDFGLSMMKSETETSQSTAMVRGIGTPKYSAPEVLSGEELTLQAMCKADVYSMSVVAWEVICQEVPFSGLNIHQLRRRVLGGGVILEIPIDVEVEEDVVDLLKQCWKDANKRPSAQAFRDHMTKLHCRVLVGYLQL